MKRFALGLGVVSLCGYGLASSLAACGGDDDATVPDADGGNASSTSSGSSSGSTTSSGGSSGTTTSSGGSSSGGTNDAGDAATDGSTAVTSNPNKISCGTAECSSATEICCRGFNDAGCVGANANCNGVKVECDEKADCAGGDICCFNALQGTARCDPSCKGGGTFQTCKTNTECSSGTCKEYTCPGNTKFRSCTAIQGCQ